MKRRRGRDQLPVADRPADADLQVAVVAPPDATRLDARDRAKTAAIAHGRLTLFDEASAAARETAMRGFARSGFSGTWAFTEMAMSTATSRDRVAAAAAFEEAAMAAVVEDVVDEGAVDVLRSTSNELGLLTGIVPAGSIAAVGSPGRSVGGPIVLALLGTLAVSMFALGLGTASVVTMAFAVAFLVGLIRRRRQDP